MKELGLGGSSERIETIKSAARSLTAEVAELAEQICLIPAPGYQEEDRARFVASQLETRGLAVEIDDIFNVYARIPGAGNGKALMISAHTDTVFPAGTPITVQHADGRLVGPAIGDNSAGVACLLGTVDLIRKLDVQLPGDIVLVANVGEEGLGNLRGIRAAVDRFDGEIGGVIALEGHNLGRVTKGAVGSTRIRITVTGHGGHSWGAFGEPSAIHALAAIVFDISRLQVPLNPKTTYNVGLIEGGVSVNTIAPHASAVVDMRSIDPASLARLSDQVEKIVHRWASNHITTEIEILGERPAGDQPLETPIVQAAIDTLAALGFHPEVNASSTDANIPIARGIPAVCIGLTHGDGAHRVDEWIEIAPLGLGLAQIGSLIDRWPVAG